MSHIETYYKIISPRAPSADITDSQDIAGGRGLYGNYTWYHRLVQGSANRVVRYREYDIMDNDVDVARALDIIAQEMTGNNPKTNLPLEVRVTAGNEQSVDPIQLVTIHAAVKSFCKLQKLDTLMYSIARNLIKYGDTFYLRPDKKRPSKKWKFIHSKNVVGAIVSSDDLTEVRGWHIKTDAKQIDANTSNMSFNTNGTINDYNVEVFNEDEIVRFSLSDEMSEEAPFGVSILVAAYRVFKQKELLEDSIIIYRIVRAPERRVFYINTGNMSPDRAAAQLEQIKNEVNQRKIPTSQGGKDRIESIYNPQSMMENFYFSVKADGSGSRVETLPGGQNLGELQDLQYFYDKMWRGLKIPKSYIDGGSEGGAPFNDGKVGIAFMQEIKFAQYIERLQKYIEVTLDREFKRFLYEQNIVVDPTVFELVLPQPTNWSKSRQQAIDSELVNVYNNIKDDTSISRRFAKEKYLGWSKDELLRNEWMVAEEKGLNPAGGKRNLPKIYFPEEAEAGGFEGSLGGAGGSSDFGGDMGEEGDLEGTGDEENPDQTENPEEGGEAPPKGAEKAPPKGSEKPPAK